MQHSHRLEAFESNVATPFLRTSPSMGCPSTVSAATLAISVQVEGSLDPYCFNMFMGDLLAEHGKDITCMRGILNIQVSNDSSNQFKFEGAHATVRYGPSNRQPSETLVQTSRLTFSGLDVPQQDVQEALNTCVYQPLAAGWSKYFTAHRPFYVHHATGRKQWNRPAAGDAPAMSITPRSTQATQHSDSGPNAAEEDLPGATQLCTASQPGVSSERLNVSQDYSYPTTLLPSFVLSDTKQHRPQQCMTESGSLQQMNALQAMPVAKSANDASAAAAFSTAIHACSRAKRPRPSIASILTKQDKLSTAKMQAKQDLMWHIRCWRLQEALPDIWLTTLSC